MDTVRMSCASFVRIQCDGRYVLLVNRDRETQGGKRILSPIGGAIEVGARKGAEIMYELDLTPQSFDKMPGSVIELRFTVDRALVPQVCKLYYTWNTNPMRELLEELGPRESGIFTAKELVAAKFKLRFAGVHSESASTHRSGQSGKKTIRLVSVYDLQDCSEAAIEKLWGTGYPLFYATEQEIRDGWTKDGVEIAPISRALLKPKRRFEL